MAIITFDQIVDYQKPIISALAPIELGKPLIDYYTTSPVEILEDQDKEEPQLPPAHSFSQEKASSLIWFIDLLQKCIDQSYVVDENIVWSKWITTTEDQPPKEVFKAIKSFRAITNVPLENFFVWDESSSGIILIFAYLNGFRYFVAALGAKVLEPEEVYIFHKNHLEKEIKAKDDARKKSQQIQNYYLKLWGAALFLLIFVWIIVHPILGVPLIKVLEGPLIIVSSVVVSALPFLMRDKINNQRQFMINFLSIISIKCPICKGTHNPQTNLIQKSTDEPQFIEFMYFGEEEPHCYPLLTDTDRDPA